MTANKKYFVLSTKCPVTQDKILITREKYILDTAIYFADNQILITFREKCVFAMEIYIFTAPKNFNNLFPWLS